MDNQNNKFTYTFYITIIAMLFVVGYFSYQNNSYPPVESPQTSQNTQTVEQSPATSTQEGVQSVDTDFVLGAPKHAESYEVYDYEFGTESGPLVAAYKGTEAYSDMYNFSVGVKPYIESIRETLPVIGMISEFEETSDSQSYIVVHGNEGDGRIGYQLYIGMDGAQEVSISATYQAEELTTENITEVSLLISSYLGTHVDEETLTEIVQYMSGDKSAYTLLVMDSKNESNLQISTSKLEDGTSFWDFMAVHLIQESQIPYQEYNAVTEPGVTVDDNDGLSVSIAPSEVDDGPHAD